MFGDHLVLVTTARWRTHACCKITVSQPWRKYSCVAFFEAAGAKFCDNATAWTALKRGMVLKKIHVFIKREFSYIYKVNGKFLFTPLINHEIIY